MTNDYIESTCGIHNGVRFEQLQVDSFYEDKTPKIYRVILAFEGHLKDSIYKTQIDRIYFNRPTGMYKWRTDTIINELYLKSGVHRKRIDKEEPLLPDSIKEVVITITKDSIVRREAEPIIIAERHYSNPQMTCPIKFKPDTWYYVDFYDQRYEAYLYIDKDMNYKVHKINLPTNF